MFRAIRFAAVAAAALFSILAAGAVQAQQAPVTVRIGYIPVMGAAQVFVAQGEGWFKKEGLNVVLTKFESGPNLIQAVASGTIDVYNAGFAPLLVARSKGQDVRVIAATVVEELGIAAAEQLTPFFAGKKVNEKAAALKAFREKHGRPAKFATQPVGSGPHSSLVYWLTEVIKADKADYEIVEIGIDATQRAILTGAVDGGSIREPALSIVRKQNPKITLIADGAEIFPNFPGVVLAVTGDFATKNPDAVKKLIRLTVRATEFLEKNPQKSVPHLGEAFGKGLLPDEILLASLKSPATRFVADPNRITKSAAAIQDFQVKIGVLKKADPIEPLFALDVYKAAIAGQ
jgi:NitT/TauT family transport system substrate-binding protein